MRALIADLIVTTTTTTTTASGADRVVAALHHLTEFYVLILAYALAALAVSVLAQWYLRTTPGTTYTATDRDTIARLHLRYRARH